VDVIVAARRAWTIAMLAFCLLSALPLRGAAEAGDPLVLYFYEDGCPACVDVKEHLDALVDYLPQREADIASYEVSEEGVWELLRKLESAYKVEILSLPAVFVGDHVFKAGQEPQISDAITRCARESCASPLAAIAVPPFPWGDILRLGGFSLLFFFFLFVLQAP